jgi:porin
MSPLRLPRASAAALALTLVPLATATPQGETPTGFLDQPRLTGDWGGVRSDLAERGVTIELTLIQDLFQVLSGGLDEDGSHGWLADVAVGLDLDTLAGWHGASFFVQGFHVDGTGPNKDSGAFQGHSNIQADEADVLAAFWYEQWLLDGRLRLKLGKVDLGSEFGQVENSGPFLNGSFGLAPTIVGGPGFPNPAWSANLEVLPTEHTFARFGLYDGATQDGTPTGTHGASTLFGDPSDLFLIGEVGLYHGRALGGRVAVGYYEHTGDFSHVAAGEEGQTEDGTAGGYLHLDQGLWRGQSSFGQALDGFCKVGFADDEVSAAALHVGVGAVMSGFLGREDDLLGLALTYVDLTSTATIDEPYELQAECFWRWQATPFLSVKPDLQYVHRTGGSSDLDDALLIGARLEWKF